MISGDLIKNLNSDNDAERQKAIVDADGFLKKSTPVDRTGVNRTVINKNAYAAPQAAGDSSTEQGQGKSLL